jgi:FkbM family methyltransferase
MNPYAGCVYARVVAHPWIAPLKPTWQRAALTDSPLRFFAREVLRRRRAARYSLRDAPDVPLSLRHVTPDVESFDQVFRQRALEEPDPVRQLIDGLGRPPVVIDLGANVGLSAAWFSARWPGARIVCVEPDPVNLEALRDAADRADGRWHVVEAAAAAEAGTLEFAAGAGATSRARQGGGTTVRAIDFFALAAEERPDLVKIDIEGGEWALFADPRMADLSALAIGIEVHPHLCPAPDARAVAVASLRRAGYEVTEVPHVAGAPADEASLWAWRATR